MSGCSVERRDQVRTTFLSFARFSASIFTIRCPSINGPFFVDRAISLLRFRGSTPYSLFPVLLLALAAHDERIGPLVVACLVTARRLSPRGHRMASARGLAFAAAVRMVHRVHCHAAVGWANALPAVASRLANRHILVVRVAYLANRRHAI